MRQVRLEVYAYEKALVFKSGQLVRVLDRGRYWISSRLEVVKYDITELFYHEIDIDLMIRNRHGRLADDEIVRDDQDGPIHYSNKEDGEGSDQINNLGHGAAGDMLNTECKPRGDGLSGNLSKYKAGFIGFVLVFVKEFIEDWGFDYMFKRAKLIIPGDIKELISQALVNML